MQRILIPSILGVARCRDRKSLDIHITVAILLEAVGSLQCQRESKLITGDPPRVQHHTIFRQFLSEPLQAQAVTQTDSQQQIVVGLKPSVTFIPRQCHTIAKHLESLNVIIYIVGDNHLCI